MTAAETLNAADACGRVLADDVMAPIDLPPFESSAMDGYAYPAAGIGEGDRLSIVGESLAGHPFQGRIDAGQCIRITTGAAVPETADTVVIQENCEAVDGHVRLLSAPQRGENIRGVGHDIRCGQNLCAAGTRLSPFDVAWLAACGITTVACRSRPGVAVFSTGDELVAPGASLEGGQIFDANRRALMTMLERLPVAVTDLGILPDDKDTLRTALHTAAEHNALLLTSGGVSVGDADYVRDVVAELGRIDLWRLNLKPGKPLAFGSVGGALFIGLPGNPVSAIVTYLLIARPVILKLCGTRPSSRSTMTARLADRLTHSPGREEYQRGITEHREGALWVRVSGDQSSNRLATFHDADCLIRVPKDAGNLAAGTEVGILPFWGLLD